MKIWASLPEEGSLQNMAYLAQRAEELGFDGVSTPENRHDPFFPLLLAAEHTQNLLIGTSVAIAFPRSPMITANIAWDLQAFSKGRFVLGLGTQVKGHNIRRFSVPWVAPGPRLREYVQSLRAIWDCWQNGTPLSYAGRHYHFTLMTPMFNPGPIQHPVIPVQIAAVNPYMCRLAGEMCDGILLHSLCTTRYIREIVQPALTEGALRAGRSLGEVEVDGGGFVISGADAEEVARNREVARKRMAFYASTRTYKPAMDLHGWSDTAVKLHEMSLRGLWDDMTHEITDEMVAEFAAVGTYEEIPEKLAARYSGTPVSRLHIGVPLARTDLTERLQAMVAAIKSL
ncbi:MAG: TIGR03617 family F420-dependent LLM class oxidoreductase [Chloroflexi bacterium]|nr:TIGR03617 family F420-dependent LLM class oxidoreductase [Chloroflexota bacterium]